MTEGRLDADYIARIERDARRMRSEAVRAMGRGIAAWFRNLTHHGDVKRGQAA